jgi:hypothetical protein
LAAFAADLEALANGTTAQMAEHRREGYPLLGWAETGPHALVENVMGALENQARVGREPTPPSLDDLRRWRAEYTADAERFERWLERAERLLEQNGGER